MAIAGLVVRMLILRINALDGEGDDTCLEEHKQ